MIHQYSTSFVRPSNATAYAAGDAVCDADGTKLTFVGNRELPICGKIIGAKMSVSIDSVVNPSFVLFLFRDDANIPSLTDNSAFAMTAAAEDDMIGSTAFTLIATGTSGGLMTWDYNVDVNIPFEAKDSSGVRQGLYGVLTASAAYDPYSPSTTVDVTLWVEDGRYA